MIRHEIKSQLAKLLATEDLVVEHKNIETACFNVHTRVLTLPMWQQASGQVYDMLVGHEVGHALYTPDNDWFRSRNIPPQFVNVVEDVRIEKLMKRRYLGISKTFYRGYQELAEEDFFQIADENLNTMNLADKANLHFKIGNFVDIDFSSEESVLIGKIANTETFDDVLDVAEELYNFCKKQQEMKTKTDDLQIQGGQEGGEDQPEVNNDQDPGIEQPTNDAPQEESDEFGSEEPEEGESYGGTDNDDEPEVSTMDTLEDALKELARNDGMENVYIEIPKIDLKRIIVSNSEVHSRFGEWDEWLEEHQVVEEDIFGSVDKEFLKFKKSAQKEVNYLVKEFECKKAAESYSRSMTSRSGVLDCSKLHTYKFNDDLFKKVTTLPEGKNHGMLFILDWSGSMGTTMLATIKQLIILCMFCKKVQIPFEVYAFTNEWVGAERAMNNTTDENDLRREYYNDRQFLKKNELYVSKSYFRMMNIFSSRSNSKNWERQCLNIWREVYAMCMYVGYQQTIGMGLSGTPLNESIVIMKHIIPQFQKTSGVSKINLCILTDGEGCSSGYGAEVQYHDEEPHIVGRRIDGGDVILRDRKIGRTYNYQSGWSEQTNVFIQNLKESNPNVSVMGIRLLDGGSGLSTFYRRYCVDSVDGMDKLYKDWKKTKSVILPNPLAYDALYVMSAKNNSSSSTEMEVEAGSSKTQVRAAFRKMLKQKQTNKQVLNHFISQIA